jgi:fermentation-respiration switch protein FrsA (DUF1100 family)
LDLLENLGESVLVFDYPGYGLSEGKPSEAGCYAAADAAYDWLGRVDKVWEAMGFWATATGS